MNETYRMVLYLEPCKDRTAKPIIDGLTRKITASLRKAKNVNGMFGWHTEPCGCNSSCCDHQLPNGLVTNSLAIHYIAFHRHEIPTEDIELIEALADGEEEPTVSELWPQFFDRIET